MNKRKVWRVYDNFHYGDPYLRYFFIESDARDYAIKLISQECYRIFKDYYESHGFKKYIDFKAEVLKHNSQTSWVISSRKLSFLEKWSKINVDFIWVWGDSI